MLETLLIDFDELSVSDRKTDETDEKELKQLLSDILVLEPDNYIGLERGLIVNPLVVEETTRCMRLKLKETDDLIANGRYKEAMGICHMIFRESLNVFYRSPDDYLNDYLRGVMKFCKSRFLELLNTGNEAELNKCFVNGLLEIVENEPLNERQAIEEFVLFYEELSGIAEVRDKIRESLEIPLHTEITLVSLFKLIVFYRSGHETTVEKIVQINHTDDEVCKKYVLMLAGDGRISEAAEFCIRHLEDSTEINKEGIDRGVMLINENDYTYWISYREWYCTQIVDFLIALDQKKRAIDFVSKTFLDRGVNGHYERHFRTRCYIQLSSKLKEEEKNELFNFIMEKNSLLHINDIEDICVYEKKWPDFINSFMNKGTYLGYLNRCYSDHMEEFRNYPADLTSTYRYVVENYAAKNPSAIIEIKTGLNVLFSLPGNEAIVLDMLYLLRINYPRSRKLQNMIKEFLNESRIAEKFNELVEEKRLSRAGNRVEISLSGSKPEKESWADTAIYERYISFLGKKNSLYETIRTWPNVISILNHEQINELVGVYKNSVFNYIDKSKHDLLTRFGNIVRSFEVLKESGIDEKLLQKTVFEIVLLSTIRFRKKIEFNSMLSSYIADIGYADAFEAYSRENITSFESEWQAQVPGKKHSLWADPAWAENMITKMAVRDRFYEITRDWPEDFSVLPENMRGILLNLYQQAAMKFAASEKYNMKAKYEKFIMSFEILKKSIGDQNIYENTVHEVVSGIRQRFPKRVELTGMLESYIARQFLPGNN